MNARQLAEGFVRAGAVLSLLVPWEIVSRAGLIPQLLAPGLADIGAAFWAALLNGDLVYHASFSLWRALAGFGMAVAVGIPLGAAMARARLFEAVFEPVFSFSYPVPKIALYPIFIFIFGLGSGSKVALVFLECLYPITVNAYFGIRGVEPAYLRAALNMGARPLRLFWRVVVPAAAPDIFAGIRIALPVAFIVVILAEMIGESVGLGYYISYQSVSFDNASSMAGIAAVAIIGFCLDRLLIAIRARLVFWEHLDRVDR